jgi:hypothetical protein
MRSKLMFCVVLALASAAYAREPKAYQTGNLLISIKLYWQEPRRKVIFVMVRHGFVSIRRFKIKRSEV